MTVTCDPDVLSDAQWARLAPLMPGGCNGKRGPRTDNRLFLNAVLWMTRTGERWKDLPERFGKIGTVNRRPRPDGRGTRQRSTAATSRRTAQPTAVKRGENAGHRPLAGRPDHQDPCPHGRPRPPWRPLADAWQRQRRDAARAVLGEAPGQIRRLAADKGYDADWLRADLLASGVTPFIQGKRCRKRKIRHDGRRYRERWRIEATFNRLKDLRRIATHYAKLARNYASALTLAFGC